MPPSAEDLAVFDGLSSEQVRAVLDIFDETVSAMSPRDTLGFSSGLNLEEPAIRSLERVFYGFFQSALEQADAPHALQGSGLSAEKQSMLLEAYGKIRERVSAQGQSPHLRPKRTMRSTMEMLGYKYSGNAKSIAGILADYVDKDEDPAELVRSVRNGI